MKKIQHTKTTNFNQIELTQAKKSESEKSQ